MKFWLAALTLAALSAGGWYATRPSTSPPPPEFLGHFAGVTDHGEEVELFLQSATERPGCVGGNWRIGGEGAWENVWGPLRRTTLLLHRRDDTQIHGRFLETRSGEWVLDTRLGQDRTIRLVRIYSTAEDRFERSDIHTGCAHPVLTSGAQTLRDAIRQAREEAVERCRTTFREYVEAWDEEKPAHASWEYSESWHVGGRTDEVVSLLGKVSYDTGGAHPNSGFMTRTFRLTAEGAKEIHLEDLFNPGAGWLEDVSSRVLEQLREAGASDIVDGRCAGLDGVHLAFWLMSRKGIEFHFAPYAMGCYVEGAYDAIVKYEDIRGLLDPMGPAATFLR